MRKKILLWLGSWTSDSKYKGQTEPAQQVPRAYADDQGQQRLTDTMPKYPQQCCKGQAVYYSSVIRAAQEQQFRDGEFPVGKPELFQQCQEFFFSGQRKIYPQKSNADSHWMPLNNSTVSAIKHFLVFFRTNLIHIVASYLCCLPPTS